MGLTKEKIRLGCVDNRTMLDVPHHLIQARRTYPFNTLIETSYKYIHYAILSTHSSAHFINTFCHHTHLYFSQHTLVTPTIVPTITPIFAPTTQDPISLMPGKQFAYRMTINVRDAVSLLYDIELNPYTLFQHINETASARYKMGYWDNITWNMNVKVLNTLVCTPPY